MQLFDIVFEAVPMSALLKLLSRIRPILIEIPSSFLWMLVVMETQKLYLINMWFRVKLGLIRLTFSLSVHFSASLRHKSNSFYSSHRVRHNTGLMGAVYKPICLLDLIFKLIVHH